MVQSSAAWAQRVIEETLVVTDPTVARAGRWKLGVAGEYWSTYTAYDIVDSSGRSVGEASLTLNQSGLNAFLAYGNITFQGTRRSGEGDFEAQEGTFRYGGPQKQTDEEFTVRWLFPARRISPYVLLGYASTEVKQTQTIRSGGNWFCTGTPTMVQTTVYQGPLVGGGAIVPFSERLGMRGDIRLNWNSGENRFTGPNCPGSTGTGLGYAGTVTGYWNIIGGLNLQLGFKMTWLNAGEDVPDWFKWGIFGMLGYTFQF